MIDLLQLHKYFILNHLKEGDVAVDFTMGNGYDTEFLSKTVGPNGRVYAFDIQKQAVDSTARHLKEVGCPDNYTLIHDSHQYVKNYVKEPIKAGMFNLGWLPGGDKSITTLRETTLPAIEAAIDLMDKDQIIKKPNEQPEAGIEERSAMQNPRCQFFAALFQKIASMILSNRCTHLLEKGVKSLVCSGFSVTWKKIKCKTKNFISLKTHAIKPIISRLV
jgi:hypothetical protein